jgi:phage terminase Nu1 subunit (DNA packaging protein)
MSSDSRDRLLGDLEDVEAFADELPGISRRLQARVDADPERVERGLAQLVLTLIDLLRQLMERQAIRRMEADSLTDEQVERMGQTFMKLERRMEELKLEFGLEDEDLNLNLGPLGDLL